MLDNTVVRRQGSRRLWSRRQIASAGLITAAWALLIVWAATPYGALLDHTAIDAHTFSAAVRWPAFLAGWALMVVAMMLPASAPGLWPATGEEPEAAERAAGASRLRFLPGYLFVWLVFGAALYAGDLLLHEAVHSGAISEAAERLIPVVLLAAAGVYQFTSLRERFRRRHCAMSGAEGGREAGLVSVGACGPVMLVMFGLGGGFSLAPMLALTAYGIVERAAGGRYLAWGLGAVLLLLAGLEIAA
jgi:predicted metal-binding membrane protein